MKILIKNALTPKQNQLKRCQLLINGERIEKLSFEEISTESLNVFDADGLLLLPGIIDPHVHLREPGSPDKENMYSGSCAAAAGGVSTVLDMPNTNPPTLTLELLSQKRQLAAKMVVNYGFYFGGTKSAVAAMKSAQNIPGTKVYMDITTGKLIERDTDSLLEIFKASKLVAVHAEEENVSLAIALAEKAQKTLYCCHISTARELDIIAEAKNRGRPVKCEAAPHHLFLTEEDDTSGFTKMKPPLRSKNDVNALWEAIQSGLVDTIGTDHAPHTLSEKESDKPPFGVPGLETSLPLMLSAVQDGRLTYDRLRALMCENPADIFGIKDRGKLEAGYYADCVLVDIQHTRPVRGNALHTKCRWSPFEGRFLSGWPKYTFVNGKLVYEEGKIHNIPAGELEIV